MTVDPEEYIYMQEPDSDRFGPVHVDQNAEHLDAGWCELAVDPEVPDCYAMAPVLAHPDAD